MNLLHGTRLKSPGRVLKEGLKPANVARPILTDGSKDLENYLCWKERHSYVYLTADLLEAVYYAYYGSHFKHNLLDRMNKDYDWLTDGQPYVVVIEKPGIKEILAEYKFDFIPANEIKKIITINVMAEGSNLKLMGFGNEFRKRAP